ncbi:hypothetical protein GGX14DRAFT_390112 [Mycena pura]|uniref:DUF6532 domain-containing protein n=1 Tax=Mycena pura TaxID=153505 RepID=A0AAD6YH16_9AGAR|nr:hypothetical protein GGX14DRAFT_390112 [Mycena pura]
MPTQPSQQSARKRSSGKATKRKVPSGEAADTEYQEKIPVKRRRKAASMNIPARSPLPDRSTRVKNPGAPDLPTEHRSSEELELDEEEEAEDEESTVINNITDLQMMDTERFAMHGSRVDDEAAFFLDNLQMSDELDDPESLQKFRDSIKAAQAEFEATKASVAKTVLDSSVNEEPETELEELAQPLKKKAKGHARSAIEAAKEEIIKRKEKERRSADEERLKRIQAKFPTKYTGLDPNWRQTSSGTSGLNKRVTGLSVATPKATKDSNSTLGGLTDADSAGIGPAKSKAAKGIVDAKLERNPNRVNQDVTILSSDSDDDTPAPTQRAAYIQDARKKTGERPKPRPLTRAPAGPSGLELQSTVVIIPSADPIPSEVAAYWDGAFIPTLLSVLGCSLEPWLIKPRDIESAFIAVYPNVKYDIKNMGNPLMKKARDRLNNGRSWIGSHAIAIVTRHFQGKPFTDLPTDKREAAIAKYATYALTPQGPMLFAHPAPENDPDALPSGFCQSTFVIDILSAFLKKTAHSCKNYGYPIGAVCLIAAALERAFSMYTTGQLAEEAPQFSQDNVGGVVEDYLDNIKRFSDRKWVTIMQLCGVPSKADETLAVASPSLQARRRTLYVPSSPAAGSDDD